MEQYIGCDSHRRYSIFAVMNERGQASAPMRVEHDRGDVREFLRELPVGSQVAIESAGGWYWLVDEMEAAGLNRNWRTPTKPSSEWLVGIGPISLTHEGSPWSY